MFQVFASIPDPYGVERIVKVGRSFTDVIRARMKLGEYRRGYVLEVGGLNEKGLNVNRPVAARGMPNVEAALELLQ